MNRCRLGGSRRDGEYTRRRRALSPGQLVSLNPLFGALNREFGTAFEGVDNVLEDGVGVGWVVAYACDADRRVSPKILVVHFRDCYVEFTADSAQKASEDLALVLQGRAAVEAKLDF